jgi:hypothetical protein
MEKVMFNKEETKNLLGMLKSTDKENHTVAFEALKNADLKKYLGELLVLYKYAKLPASDWQNHCPEAWIIINKHVDSSTAIALTSGKCLSIMTEQKATKASMELYLEHFVVDMVGFLGQLGYPADKFNINIELKE